MKQWLTALILLAVGGGVLAWYVLWEDAKDEASTASGSGWKPPTPTVEVAPVAIGSVVRSVEAVGTLRANEAITARPEIAGRVSAIHFAEGQPVEAGAPLVSLDDSVHQAEVMEKQADRRIAELAFERSDKLLKRGATPVEERDRALAQLQADDAALQLAKARLAKTRILAPFAGIVGLRHVSNGDFVAAGAPLVSLVQVNPLKVDFRVGEVYLPQVAEGQEITVEVDAYPDRTFTGQVFAIEPQVDVSGRAVVIRASLPNADLRLRPGLFSRVDLIVDAAAEAILVPEAAIVPRGEQHYVYQLKDDRAVLTEVILGKRSRSQVEVRSGLARNAVVVTAGQIKLRDGVAVRVMPARDGTTGEAQVTATDVSQEEPGE